MNQNLPKNSAVFLAIVLVAGTISMIVPSSFAQEYHPQDPYAQDPYAQDPYAQDPYAQDPYTKDQKKSTSVNIQKIKCVNENLNVNGIQINQVPESGIAAAEAQAEDAGTANGNGPMNGDGINFDKNLVNICVNVNVNEQVDVNEDDNGPLPPPEVCSDCFEERPDGPIPPGLLDDLEEYLANNQVTLGSVNPRTANVGSTDGLCTALVTVDNNQNTATADQIRAILEAAFPGGSNPDAIDDVIECLRILGLIVDVD